MINYINSSRNSVNKNIVAACIFELRKYVFIKPINNKNHEIIYNYLYKF